MISFSSNVWCLQLDIPSMIFVKPSIAFEKLKLPTKESENVSRMPGVGGGCTALLERDVVCRRRRGAYCKERI
jgi:hypothetical protein